MNMLFEKADGAGFFHVVLLKTTVVLLDATSPIAGR
jgi:hypothetical protein